MRAQFQKKMDKFKERMRQEFKLVDVPGDGDCFFHVLAHGLKQSGIGNLPKDVTALREFVANWAEKKENKDVS